MSKLEIKITKTSLPKQKPDFKNNPPAFGKETTDHMFLMEYITAEQKWVNPRIEKYAPIEFELTTAAFHYGQTVFEGLKAYKSPAGDTLVFRPYENAKRFNKSAYRMCMPEMPEEYFVQAISELVALDSDWIPDEPGTALYIRPFMIASDNAIGLFIPARFLFAVVLCPVGAYISDGSNTVAMLVEEKYVRAAPGGTGFAKCGGNYAGSFRASQEAREKGYDQILWLDAVERKYIEEVGAMNIFFVIDGQIVTPKTGDTILDGITRKSVIEMLKDWGYSVSETKISIEEFEEAHKQGRVSEVFGAGTAAVITPIGKLTYKNNHMIFNGEKAGDISKRLYEELTGLQTGQKEDKFGWTIKL